MFSRLVNKLLRVGRSEQPTQTLNARVLFVHFPKCGGTSVEHAVWRACFPPGDPRVHSLTSAASARAAEYCGQELLAYRQQLLPYFLLQDGARFVTGHFGVNERVWRRFSPDWLFATTLRDPVDRWLSHYFFNRKKTGDADPFRITADLETYLGTDEAANLGRLYVRNLTAGLDPADPISAALEMIDRFDIVGFLDRMPQFVDRFAEATGVRLELYRENVNVSAEAQRIREVTPAVRSRIEELCEPDRIVYYHALKRRTGAVGEGVTPAVK